MSQDFFFLAGEIDGPPWHFWIRKKHLVKIDRNDREIFGTPKFHDHGDTLRSADVTHSFGYQQVRAPNASHDELFSWVVFLNTFLGGFHIIYKHDTVFKQTYHRLSDFLCLFACFVLLTVLDQD